MPDELILVNGDIRTMNPAQPRATAAAMRGGEIVFVGGDDDARRQAGARARVIDLRGRLALPGWTDAHVHFGGFAQTLDRVNLDGCQSVEEAAARVARRVQSSHGGETLNGFGWNHLDWAVPLFPDKHMLDAVAPHNPVILTRKDGHSAWVNSAALRQWGLARDTPDPAGGKLERDAAGEPTGILRENALELIGKGIGKDDEEISDDALLRAIARAHAAGLTGIHTIEGANALGAWQSLHAHGKLRLRVVHTIPDTGLEHALALGIRRRLGDEWLRLQAVKLFADGSLGSQTAEMREPFEGSDGNCGTRVTDSGTLLRLARAAVQGGLDVWVHAIGDAAIGRVLTVFETLRGEGHSEAILRLEHVQHLFPGDLPRFGRANVIASVQPIHQPADRQMVERLLGPERARWTYAFRSLFKSGATLAFGSDAPVESLEPLRGIHAAVTRQSPGDEPRGGWFPQERLGVEDAVRAYTRGAACAAGDAGHAGLLGVGCRADVVILGQNILEIPPREILNTTVDYTIVGGQVVHEKKE